MVKYENDLPVVIEENVKQKAVEIYLYKKEDGTHYNKVIPTGEVQEITNFEKFQYDPDQKMLTYQRIYNQHVSIKMSPIPNSDKNKMKRKYKKIQSTHHFHFDELDRLKAIYREDGSLLEKIYYQQDSQLIDYYEVFNLKDDLEITVKINYEFY